MAEYPQDVVQRFHGTPEQARGRAGGRAADGRGSPSSSRSTTRRGRGRFVAARSSLTEALGDLIIDVEHVGSTAVPGLAAKPVIDIDLIIGDTAEEAAYLPALERLGYRLVLREPWWHGHRMLLSAAEDVNLHVWPQGAPEPVRHRLFRDWLRSHPQDRELYAATKRRLARDTADRPGDYSLAKNDVIDEIYARIFAAAAAAATEADG